MALSLYGKKAQSRKGVKLWLILVRVVVRWPMSRDICAIPVEIKPSVVFVELQRQILRICARINCPR